MPFQVKTLRAEESSPYQAFTFPLFRPRFALLHADVDSPLLAVGAQSDETPVGLALFETDPSGLAAELLSVFTLPAYRGRGVATQLIAHAERVLTRKGVRSVKAVYEQGRPHSPALERLLTGLGYPPPAVRAYVGRVEGYRLRDAAWLKPPQLPRCFEIFLWRDLSALERRRIQRSQAQTPWYPDTADPFRFEPVEPLNSVGLRYENDVVGWQINHRIAEDTIRYTSLHVRQDLRETGVATALLRASSWMHLHSGDSRLSKATFVVPVQQEGMVKFVRERMAPFLNELNASVETVKRLE